MLNGNEHNSPENCRGQRLKTRETRRWTAVTASILSTSQRDNRTNNSSTFGVEEKLFSMAVNTSSSSASSGEDMEASSSTAAAARCLSGEEVVVFGTMSVAGRQREMEDTIFVRTNLCRPEINRRRPVHFFGVYDGHGGTHVAAQCRDKMHVLMEEELMRLVYMPENESGGTPQVFEEEAWTRAIKRCFERMDEVALNTCACGSTANQCGCQSMEVALAGSTAVVALVTTEYIVLANCGDSRAVLSRGGTAIPLSSDHKPDREDELARIQASGGRVIFVNGARVEGILAMSRAIGDKYLKPLVTADPEIAVTKRFPEDECLIMASDGLWDVLPNELACTVASQCLREGNLDSASSRGLNVGPQIKDEGAGDLYPSRSASAAALLTRLALGRRSSDNISVIVVDLRRR